MLSDLRFRDSWSCSQLRRLRDTINAPTDKRYDLKGIVSKGVSPGLHGSHLTPPGTSLTAFASNESSRDPALAAPRSPGLRNVKHVHSLHFPESKTHVNRVCAFTRTISAASGRHHAGLRPLVFLLAPLSSLHAHHYHRRHFAFLDAIRTQPSLLTQRQDERQRGQPRRREPEY